MRIKIDHTINKIISKEYVEIEYVMEEVLPMLDMIKCHDIPSMLCIESDDYDEIEISDDIVFRLHKYFNNNWSEDKMITYIISIGYILGV